MAAIRWYPGMLTFPTWADGPTVFTATRCWRVERVEDREGQQIPQVLISTSGSTAEWCDLQDPIPDFSDTVTLAALTPMARAVWGPYHLQIVSPLCPGKSPDDPHGEPWECRVYTPLGDLFDTFTAPTEELLLLKVIAAAPEEEP